MIERRGLRNTLREGGTEETHFDRCLQTGRKRGKREKKSGVTRAKPEGQVSLVVHWVRELNHSGGTRRISIYSPCKHQTSVTLRLEETG